MKKIIIPILAVAAIFSSCEEQMDIQFDASETKHLVVEGGLTTDTTAHQIRLSWTDDYFAAVGDQKVVEHATISISNNSQMFEFTETEPGIYKTESNAYGQVNSAYILTIELEDGSVFTAKDSIAPLPAIDSITQSGNYNHNDHMMERFGYGYDIYYYGPEKEGVGDYYMWRLYVNDTLQTDTIIETIFTDDVFVDGAYIEKFDVFFVPEEWVHGDSTKVTVEMLSISKAYYEYLYGLFFETVWRGSPWDGPPANVPTNVSNDAKGFFRASDVRRETLYIKPTARDVK